MGTFYDHAERWLVAREAENNLLLGIVGQLMSREHPYEDPIYLATVDDEKGRVHGCAFRTPPFKFGVTRLPDSSIPALVSDVMKVYDVLPAVLGPVDAAEAFAREWCAQKPVRTEVGMRMRIFNAEAVIEPTNPAPGRLRRAVTDEAALLTGWMAAFIQETGVADMGAERIVQRLIAEERLFVWDDRGPRTIAAAAGETPKGVRINHVYTPPEFRRRGYATIAVARLTSLLLSRGRRCCYLYTDLANLTSNGIYQRIGYRPVADVVDLKFVR